MAKKKPIISSLGQWAYPGEVTIIPSSKITMKGVNYPILGVDDFGNSQVMMPGAEYEFPGNYVTEYPQMGKGGEMIKRKDGSYSKRGLWDNIRANKGSGKKPTKQMLEQERKIKAKMQDGGWLNNYPKSKVILPSVSQPELNPIAMTGLMKSKIAYADAFNNPTGARLTNRDSKSYTFTSDDEYNGGAPQGSQGNVYMSSYGEYATPQIQDVNGRLQFISDPYSPENAQRSLNQSIIFNNPDEAQYFGEHYKEVAPMMSSWNKKKNGGIANESVTCSNCGHSWKISEGGLNPLGCHICGGKAKMQSGGGIGFGGISEKDFWDKIFFNDKLSKVRPYGYIPDISEDDLKIVNATIPNWTVTEYQPDIQKYEPTEIIKKKSLWDKIAGGYRNVTGKYDKLKNSQEFKDAQLNSEIRNGFKNYDPQFRDSLLWTLDYMNSPNYNRNLLMSVIPKVNRNDYSNEKEYNNEVQYQFNHIKNKRLENLKTTPNVKSFVTGDDKVMSGDIESAGWSESETGQIRTKPMYINAKNTFNYHWTNNELYPHEISHNVDRPNKFAIESSKGESWDDREIPKEDLNQMSSRLKIVPTSTLDKYYANPTEVRARLNEFRKILFEKGIDVFTKPINAESLNTLTPSGSKSSGLDELRNIYKDKDILWMLNNISKNEEPKLNIAKNGAKLQNGAQYTPAPDNRIYSDNARVVTPPSRQVVIPVKDFLQSIKPKPKSLVSSIPNSVLKTADITTDLMQIGNFIPHPIAQGIGKVGNYLGSGVDAVQSAKSFEEGDNTASIINAASAILPTLYSSKYKRPIGFTNSNYSVKKGLEYTHLNYLKASHKLNPLLKAGVIRNRGIATGLAGEILYDLDMPSPNAQTSKKYKDNAQIKPLLVPSKLQEGDWLQQYQKAGQVLPLVTNNPNDPRIGRYNDSLDLYNKTQPSFDKYKKWTKLNNISTWSTKDGELFRQYMGNRRPPDDSPYNLGLKSWIKPVEEMGHGYERFRSVPAGSGLTNYREIRKEDANLNDYLRPNPNENFNKAATRYNAKINNRDVSQGYNPEWGKERQAVLKLKKDIWKPTKTKQDFLNLGLTGVTPEYDSVFRYKKPVQPYVYRAPNSTNVENTNKPVVPEVEVQPINTQEVAPKVEIQPVITKEFISTPATRGKARITKFEDTQTNKGYERLVQLDNGESIYFPNIEDYNDWEKNNDLDWSRAQIKHNVPYTVDKGDPSAITNRIEKARQYKKQTANPKMQQGGWLDKYQTAGEVSSEQNPERMNPIEIQTERKPWYERLPRQIGNKIGLDPYHLDDKDFGSQFRQRVSDATGGADWYKQSNPFMNLALQTMNVPQLAATYGVTGKVQTPSEAMDIQNPYGAFAVDMLLDPTNLVGAGIAKNLGKGSLQNMFRSRMRGVRPSIQNSVDNIATPNISQSASISTVSSKAQELPGLHLKSTMTDGPISKIVEPKTGLVNVEQALGIIGKESGGVDKVALIKQSLGENIPKKMDYNDFRKTVQDQLIPLEKQFSTERSNYGMSRLGYAPGEFVTKEVNGKKIHTYESDYLDNQTILFSNKDKFGRGSWAHGNPEETLGHAHYLIDKESPNALTVTQIQSDAFQGPYRVMPKDDPGAFKAQLSLQRMEELQNRNKSVLNKMKTEGVDEAEVSVQDYQIKQFEDIVNAQENANLMKKAEIENFSQKSLLDKNHQERYLQELVDYAGKQGNLNKVRVPTSETAAKVQNYEKVITKTYIPSKDDIPFEQWTEIDQLPDMMNRTEVIAKYRKGKYDTKVESYYNPEQQTILKKYSEQPKTIKKLFGEEPKIVTDSKGNTWYEFDIPKKFKEGKGEIKAFSTIGGISVAGAAASQLQEQKNGGQTDWLNKYK